MFIDLFFIFVILRNVHKELSLKLYFTFSLSGYLNVKKDYVIGLMLNFKQNNLVSLLEKKFKIQGPKFIRRQILLLIL
jgi:hypothetical protein